MLANSRHMPMSDDLRTSLLDAEGPRHEDADGVAPTAHRFSELVSVAASKGADDAGLASTVDAVSPDDTPATASLWSRTRIFGAVAALTCFIAMLFVHIETPTDPRFVAENPGVSFDRVNVCFAILLPMIFMWLFSVIEPNATAMVPLVVMPMFAIDASSAIAATYLNNVALLFIGVFIVATGLEVCNVHKRFALVVLKHVAHS